MHSKIQKRTVGIGAFCSGLVGGTMGGFKEWAANISPEYANILGGLLAALVGGLTYSILCRKYVEPLARSAEEQTA